MIVKWVCDGPQIFWNILVKDLLGLFSDCH